MSQTEIVLLIGGAVIFIASFLIPEKVGKASKEDKKLGEKLVRELIEDEIKEAQNRIEDIVDETVSYSVEKTERSLERITNEKIMAVNEYSDTVLEEIHNNHKEVMFLYDMLNDKHQSLQTTMHEVNQTAKKVEDTAKTAEETVKSVMGTVNEDGLKPTAGEPTGVPGIMRLAKAAREQENMHAVQKEPAATEAQFQPITMENIPSLITATPQKAAVQVKTVTPPEKQPVKAAVKEPGKAGIHIQLEPGQGNTKNSNEKILALHRSGKSNMAIAKELGLGMGEVKLVIDLFEGM